MCNSFFQQINISRKYFQFQIVMKWAHFAFRYEEHVACNEELNSVTERRKKNLANKMCIMHKARSIGLFYIAEGQHRIIKCAMLMCVTTDNRVKLDSKPCIVYKPFLRMFFSVSRENKRFLLSTKMHSNWLRIKGSTPLTAINLEVDARLVDMDSMCSDGRDKTFVLGMLMIWMV